MRWTIDRNVYKWYTKGGGGYRQEITYNNRGNHRRDALQTVHYKKGLQLFCGPPVFRYYKSSIDADKVAKIVQQVDKSLSSAATFGVDAEQEDEGIDFTPTANSYDGQTYELINALNSSWFFSRRRSRVQVSSAPPPKNHQS